MDYLLVLVSALTAFIVVSVRDQRVSIPQHLCLRFYLGCCAISAGVGLFGPTMSPETAGMYECVRCALAALAGLAVARHAVLLGPDGPGQWRLALFRALMLAASAGALGLLAQAHVPRGLHWGYRGLIPVELATVAVLSSVGQGIYVRDRVDYAAIWSLAIYHSLQALHIFSFELFPNMSLFLAWLSILGYCWACHAIACEAQTR